MSDRIISRLFIACSIVWAVAIGPARDAGAADCWGGTLRRVYISSTTARYVGSVTFPGASHDTLIQDPESFSLTVVDAEDPDQMGAFVRGQNVTRCRSQRGLPAARERR